MLPCGHSGQTGSVVIVTQTMPLFGFYSSVTYNTGTLFYPLNGVSNVAESACRCYVPAGKSVKLCVYLRAISLNAGTVTITLRKNGADTTQKITVTWLDDVDTLITDSDEVSFADGDYMDIKVTVAGATSGAAQLVITSHWQ